jgi:hypothetical protein
MPTSIVKTKKDEDAWKSAKKHAKEQGQEENYSYIMSIYKSMTGYEAGDLKKNKKKKESLKDYLQKRLTISFKEAELIESAIKIYVRNKKQK